MNSATVKYLAEKANKIRQHIITMIGEAGSGHPGGSLSSVEIVTSLYFELMNLESDVKDKFILSKGHAAPVLYAALAEKGFIAEQELMTLRKLGSILQGHPDMKKTPGVDFSTGSLGQGLSVANGMAIAAKFDQNNRRIYVLLGDGEIQEGQVWEAAMTAAHRKLDNLIAFVDYNKLQIDGTCEEVKSLNRIQEKFAAFGWQTYEIDGHDFEKIVETVKKAWASEGKPTAIICNTVKGKGVSFMENQVGWHGKAPNTEQVQKALAELRGEIND